MADKTKKIIGIVLNVLTYVLLALAVVVLVFVMLARINGNRPVIFGYSFNLVVTKSMVPEINVGDMVVAKVVPLSEIEVGDDIVFQSDDPALQNKSTNIVVHRVRAISVSESGEYSFTTYGINNPSDDTYPAVKVLGVKVAVSSFMGGVASFFMKSINVIFIIVLVVILIFAGYLIKKTMAVVREGKEQDNPGELESTDKLSSEVDELKKRLKEQSPEHKDMDNDKK